MSLVAPFLGTRKCLTVPYYSPSILWTARSIFYLDPKINFRLHSSVLMLLYFNEFVNVLIQSVVGCALTVGCGDGEKQCAEDARTSCGQQGAF